MHIYRPEIFLCQHRCFIRMAKRKTVPIPCSTSTTKTKRQKLTDSSNGVESDPHSKKQNSARRVWFSTELGERIFRSIPRNELFRLRGVCTRFSALVKYGGVQEYLHNVPPNGKVGEESLFCCGEKIADFVTQIRADHQLRNMIPAHVSCIEGYGGDRFLENGDVVHRNLSIRDLGVMVENERCREPCFLNSRNLVACNLTPGPLKSVMCTLLASAWNVDKTYKNAVVKEPMQPDKFEVTCDARVLRNVSWTTCRITGRFSEPVPRTTFEATVNWVFELLNRYAKTRWNNLARGPSIGGDHKEAMTLKDDEIKKGFRAARDMSWSLEQTCYIIDRIPEVCHPLYNGCEDDEFL